MSRVTVETVDQVARLAHLQLGDQERVDFTRQLEQILDYAESIQSLDTSAVEPMSHASEAAVFRDDSTRSSLRHEDFFGSAPDPADGLFRVPRVIG